MPNESMRCRLHPNNWSLAGEYYCGSGHGIEMGAKCPEFRRLCFRLSELNPLAVIFVSIMIAYAALIIA